jgi:hypothetical protein
MENVEKNYKRSRIPHSPPVSPRVIPICFCYRKTRENPRKIHTLGEATFSGETSYGSRIFREGDDPLECLLNRKLPEVAEIEVVVSCQN